MYRATGANALFQVASKEGTWIDWQYLYDGATLLTQCRYTLKYTYPYAFYLPIGTRRELVRALFISRFNSTHAQFEYQQSELERAVEDLSWKLERTKEGDRPVGFVKT